ncbi:hypothetical protein B296_00001466 [Ensete ventricosum]|uniref:Uncharacterized protein n=1 Tax=Ensete ventricosum TaxID=4639 RepID=A0A427AY08_ENSVE|nr:hypothetical protein B296_00001466 [Ensete ventricosum]
MPQFVISPKHEGVYVTEKMMAYFVISIKYEDRKGRRKEKREGDGPTRFYPRADDDHADDETVDVPPPPAVSERHPVSTPPPPRRLRAPPGIDVGSVRRAPRLDASSSTDVTMSTASRCDTHVGPSTS